MLANHRLAAPAFFAVLTAAVVGLDLLTTPALAELLEERAGYGFDIEMLLRVYFGYGAVVWLQIFLCRLYVIPARDPGLRFTLGALSIEALVLLAIWVLDRNAEFSGESSALTFFSTLVLFASSLGAFLNYRACRAATDSHRLAPLFWVLVTVAFGFAGSAEFFTLHEHIDDALAPLGESLGVSAGIVQDLVAFGSFLSAVGIALLFASYIRSELRRGSRFVTLFLLAITCYGISLFNDSAGVPVEWIFPGSDPGHFMNFAEEVLELTAATLFLCATANRLIERGYGVLLTPPRSGSQPLIGSTPLRVLAATVAASTVVGSLAIASVHRPSAPEALALGNYSISVVADVHAGLDDVRGLAFDREFGLLVANAGAGEILRIDGAQPPEVLIGPAVGLSTPSGVASIGGKLHLTDTKEGRVSEWSVGAEAETRTHGVLEAPGGIVADRAGRLFVSDAALSAVFRVDSFESRVIASALDELIAPEALAIGEKGDLFVADPVAGAVFRISVDGRVARFVDDADGLQAPVGLAFRYGSLYVADRQSVQVFRFNRYGRGGPILEFTKRHRNLTSLAIDEDGNLYVAVGSSYRPHNFIFRIEAVD